MLNSNSKIKKSVILALMSFAILFAALNPICCFKASATRGDSDPPEKTGSQSDNSGNQNQQQDGDGQEGIPAVVLPVGPGQYIIIPCNIC